MEDKRAFATFDVGYLDNPKLEALLVAMPRAVLMHARSILYASQHLTDGEVSAALMQMRVGGSEEDTLALIESGLWHSSGHDCDQCPQPSDQRIYVHNYLEHNRSKASVKRLSERGAKGAKARWEDASSNASSNASSTAKTPNKQSTDRQTDRDREGRAKPARRSKLSDDFAATDAHKKKAIELNVNLEVELEKFKNHFIGNGDIKADWSRTFSNWLTRSAEFRPPSKEPSTSYIWD